MVWETALRNVGNYGEIHSSSNFLSLEKLPNPEAMPGSCICILAGSLPFQQTPPGCAPREEEETLQKQAESRVSTTETWPSYSTLPHHTLPVLMGKLLSTACPKTLLLCCVITGLIRVKPCLLSGTSCFSLVLGMRLNSTFLCWIQPLSFNHHQ